MNRKEMYLFTTSQRVLCVFLCMVLLCSSLPARIVKAMEETEQTSSKEVIYKDEYSTVFDNQDGTCTVETYSEPIRIVTDGEMIDIDTNLVEKEDDGKKYYSPLSSDTKIRFPDFRIQRSLQDEISV